MAMRQPRKPSIGLNSCEFARAVGELLRIGAHGGCDLGDFFLAVRQEFVQRRIEQADGHRPAGHDGEQLDEIGALHRQQLGDRRAAGSSRRRPGSSRAPPGCGPRRRTCARCGRDRCPRRRNAPTAFASVGVSALARTPSRRTLSAQPISVAKSSESCGSIMSTRPASTWPVEPSTVMKSPSLKLCPPALMVRLA